MLGHLLRRQLAGQRRSTKACALPLPLPASSCLRIARWNATSSDGNSTSSNSQWQWWQIWKYSRVRLFIRAARVCVLSATLFNLGLQAGLQQYAQDPTGQRQAMIKEVLAQHGCLKDGVPQVRPKDSREVQRVQQVFPRILTAAIEETRHQESELEKTRSEKEGNHSDLDDQIESVRRIRRLLKMWPHDGFLLLDRDDPNAFVTPLVPGLIFIHRGLFDTEHTVPVQDFGALDVNTKLVIRVKGGEKYFRPDNETWVTFKNNSLYKCWYVGLQQFKHDLNPQCVVKVSGPSKRRRNAWSTSSELMEISIPVEDVRMEWTYCMCETDEQLAMLLSHEMSHVVHEHGKDATYLKAVILGIQIVLLSVLDVTGLVSMLAVLGMAPVLKYSVELPNSREQEFDADATGLRIAARAGYDPHDASDFFERMGCFSHAHGHSQGRNWNSTHPRSEDRLNRLHELEADVRENYCISKTNSLGSEGQGIWLYAGAGFAATFVALAAVAGFAF